MRSTTEYNPSKDEGQWMAFTLTVGLLELSKHIQGAWLSGGSWRLHVDGIVNIDMLSQRIIVALPTPLG